MNYATQSPPVIGHFDVREHWELSIALRLPYAPEKLGFWGPDLYVPSQVSKPLQSHSTISQAGFAGFR